MATLAPTRPTRPRSPLAPDGFERALASCAIALLGVTLVALARGYDRWADMPPLVWAHLVTVGTALALTPALFLRARGDRTHRTLGWLWASAMFATALLTFGIRELGAGRLSPIHILSALTILSVPALVLSARARKHRPHRQIARGITTGGLLIAGVLTFPGSRQLGTWLFG